MLSLGKGYLKFNKVITILNTILAHVYYLSKYNLLHSQS